RGAWPNGYHSSLLIHDIRYSLNPIHTTMLPEKFSENRQGPRMVHIVRIYPPHYLPGGTMKALINGIIHPLVPLATPPSQPLLILFDNIDRPISAASIDNYIFQIRIALVEH